MAPTVTPCRENCSKSAATIDDNHHYLYLCLSLCVSVCHIVPQWERASSKSISFSPENGTICRAISVLGKCQLAAAFTRRECFSYFHMQCEYFMNTTLEYWSNTSAINIVTVTDTDRVANCFAPGSNTDCMQLGLIDWGSADWLMLDCLGKVGQFYWRKIIANEAWQMAHIHNSHLCGPYHTIPTGPLFNS